MFSKTNRKPVTKDEIERERQDSLDLRRAMPLGFTAR